MNHWESQRKISIQKTNASDFNNCSSGPQLWKLMGSGTLWLVQIHTGAYWRVWLKTAKGRGTWGLRRSINEPSEWLPNWEHMNSRKRVCGSEILYRKSVSRLQIVSEMYLNIFWSISPILVFPSSLFTIILPPPYKTPRCIPVTKEDNSSHYKTLTYLFSYK